MAPRRGLHLIAVVPCRTDSKQQAEVAALGQGEGGYGPVAALFLGSFTFRLLQIASCPVLVVPTGGRQHTA
jgi:nucleotide-binding universal stress UspA family protein